MPLGDLHGWNVMSLQSAEYADTGREPHWIRPHGEERSGQPLLSTLRAGAWFIVLSTLLSLVGLGFYLSRADDVYESSVDLLVTPTAGATTGIPEVTLLRASTDPVRNVETIARLVTAPDVIRRATRDLRLQRNPDSVGRSVHASPVAESDIVTVTASDSSPEGSQRLANAVARAAVTLRTDALHEQLDNVITRVVKRVTEVADPATKEMLTSRLADLQTFREMPDPTIRVATAAELPTSPVAPRRKLSFVIALIAGLLVGVGGVIAFQLLDPRIVDVEQLREWYRLPILAGPPRRGLRLPGLGARAVPNEYRNLRTTLLSEGGRGRAPCALLLAPSKAGARVSTLGLARSLAMGGDRILVCGIGNGAAADKGSPPGRHGALGDRAVQLAGEPEGVLLLPDGAGIDDLDAPAAARLIGEAEAIADWFLVATSSYDRSADSLALGHLAGFVIIVVRLASTRVAELRRLAELLSDHGIEPTGFVVLPSGSSDRWTTGRRPRFAG